MPLRLLVVDANTSYNIFLGRPSLIKLNAIVLTPHLVMKFHPHLEISLLSM